MLLAQVTASPTPQELKSWLEVFLYLSGVVLAAAGTWKLLAKQTSKTSIADQPISVQAHAGVATQEDLRLAHGRVTRERLEINSEIKRVENDLKERVAQAEENIGALREDSASAKTELQNQTRQLHQIQNTIEQLPEKILRIQSMQK